MFSLFYINRKHFTIEEKRSEGSPNFHNTIPLSILRGGAQKCLGLQHHTLLITLTYNDNIFDIVTICSTFRKVPQALSLRHQRSFELPPRCTDNSEVLSQLLPCFVPTMPFTFFELRVSAFKRRPVIPQLLWMTCFTSVARFSDLSF